MDDSGQEFDIKRLKHYWSHSFRWKIKWSIDHRVGGIKVVTNAHMHGNIEGTFQLSDFYRPIGWELNFNSKTHSGH